MYRLKCRQENTSGKRLRPWRTGVQRGLVEAAWLFCTRTGGGSGLTLNPVHSLLRARDSSGRHWLGEGGVAGCGLRQHRPGTPIKRGRRRSSISSSVPSPPFYLLPLSPVPSSTPDSYTLISSKVSDEPSHTHPTQSNEFLNKNNAMGTRRHFCCCIPVRAAVFISSLLSLIGGGLGAGAFFWLVHSKSFVF